MKEYQIHDYFRRINRMNILVLNGAPAGDNSITLQTALYIEQNNPQRQFHGLDV